jgi:hypothetical protein
MRWIVCASGFALVAAALIVAGALAYEACTINPGDTIYVGLPEIEDGMSFSMGIEDAVAESEDGRFEISAENFTMPFTMADMYIRVQADEATTIGLQCMRDGGVRNISTVGNELRIYSYDCEEGPCESLKVYGTSNDPTVNINLTMEGTLAQVEETSPDEFSFELYNVSDGLTNVSAELNGTELIAEVTVTSEPTGDDECRLNFT